MSQAVHKVGKLSPSIYNPYKGGVIFVTKIVTKSKIGEEIPVYNPPATSVRRPCDRSR